MAYCPSCKKTIPELAVVCPHCGYDFPPLMPTEKRIGWEFSGAGDIVLLIGQISALISSIFTLYFAGRLLLSGEYISAGYTIIGSIIQLSLYVVIARALKMK